MKNEQKTSIEDNRSRLGAIKKVMATKSEGNGLLQELNDSITGFLPSLPGKLKKEEPRKKEKKRRFPFLPRF